MNGPNPLQQLFGRKLTRRPLLGTPTPRVNHGALKRLPAFFRESPLDSVASLCSAWKGRIQVANGTEAKGLQTSTDLSPAQALGLGLTAYFPSLSELVDGADWLAELERTAGIPPGSAALMGFSNAPGTGLPVHHDAYDQILVQLVGTKRFGVRPNPWTTQPAMQCRPEEVKAASFGLAYADGFPATSAEALEDMEWLTLEPGSALYLPGGCWHTTSGQPGTTLTAVLQLRIPTRVDLLGHLLALHLSRDPHWRSRPYGLWGSAPEAARGQLQDDLRALASLLDTLEPDPAAPSWSLSQALGGTGPFPDHPWERWIRLPETAVEVREETVAGRLRLTTRLGQLVAPDRTSELTLEAATRPVLDWVLASHRAFTRTELAAEFGDPDLDALLGTLAEHHIVRPIPV